MVVESPFRKSTSLLVRQNGKKNDLPQLWEPNQKKTLKPPSSNGDTDIGLGIKGGGTMTISRMTLLQGVPSQTKMMPSPKNALNIPGHHSKLPATFCMTIISYHISAFVFDIILLVLTEIALCSNFLPVSPWVQRTKASRHPKKYASGNAVKTLISFSHLTFEWPDNKPRQLAGMWSYALRPMGGTLHMNYP